MNALRHGIFSYLFLLVTAAPALADCMAFDLEREIENIPIIVEGTVTQSNNDKGELNTCANREGEDCTYKATLKVTKVLKGEVTAKTIDVEYRYWLGCPGVDTYREGDKRIFLFKNVSADKGEFYGNSCGFGSVSLDDEKKIWLLEKPLLDSEL